MAAKYEASSQTEEAIGHQFLLAVEVLPSNNLKIGSICQGCKHQVRKSVFFLVTRSQCMAAENGSKELCHNFKICQLQKRPLLLTSAEYSGPSLNRLQQKQAIPR